MDISFCFKYVTNLNEYTSVTQDIVRNYSNSSILFNMSTVLSLKKVKSLEIEYFNKCDENGAAIIVFELILRHPPSKTWGLLGTELISLVQYWLEAIRKHLIFHNNHWWNFTTTLISFIEKISVKSKSIQDILVQKTCECLLDLATNSRTNLDQTYKILHCFNVCCAESSRAIRIAMRSKLDSYLTRVAGSVRACGDARVQLVGAQALVRWTVPRTRRDTRAAAAGTWLAPHHFPPSAVAAFVDAAWSNFPQDARIFLNALNEEGSTVVSLPCRSCTAGGAELVMAAGGDHWLDASAGSRSIALHRTADDEPVLLMEDADVDKISLQREGAGAVLRARGRARPLRAVLAPEPRALRRLHALLRAAFAHRYTTTAAYDSTVEAEEQIELSGNADSRAEASAAASAAAGGGGGGGGGRRAVRAGYVTRARAPRAPLSPSTASTSSLLMLRDKLNAFSGAVYDKEPVSVCAAPQLSNVTEVTEPEEKLNILPHSALMARSCGVAAKRKESGLDKNDSTQDTREKNKCISPIIEEDESNVSCLFVATTGSADESISDKSNRPPLVVDAYNIVDLLAQEALQYVQPAAAPPDVEPTLPDPGAHQHVTDPPIHQKQTIVSNTTTDESNTDVVENTPFTESVHYKNNVLNFDNQVVENFFSQHLAENSDRDVVVSPTLARKINRSSSESSVQSDLIPTSMGGRFGVDEHGHLNKMLDLCENLEKYPDNMHLDNQTSDRGNAKRASEDNSNKDDDKFNTKSTETVSKKLKLKFDSKNTKVEKKSRASKNKNVLKPSTQLNAVNENKNPTQAHDNVVCEESINNSDDPAAHKTPNVRRKRKLYSPKDDHMIDVDFARPDNDPNVPRGSKTDARNIPIDTPYKEIENIRNKSLINNRNKTHTARALLSPKTKKLNDIFEGLKNSIEGEKNIKFAGRKTRNREAVYNFSSDSEDEYFKGKENKIARSSKKESKRQTSTKTTKGRKGTNKNNKSRKKRPAKKSAIADEPHVELEQMRADRLERTEQLEISFEAHHHQPAYADSVPALTSDLRMECVGSVTGDGSVTEKRNTRKHRKSVVKQTTGNGRSNVLTSDQPDDKDVTVSPLPGLVIEEIGRGDIANSASICMLDGFNISADKNLSLLNSTQNLLSDADQPCLLEHDLADAASVAISNESKVVKKRQLSTRKKQLGKVVVKQEFTKEASKGTETGPCAINFDTSSEKSIATFGKSPITGHGDLDEAPPSSLLLDQRITKRRGIEAGDLSRTLKDYYNDLNREIEGISASGSPGRDRGREMADTCRHPKSASVPKLFPIVSIGRLSPDIISRWMPPRCNSVFGSDRSSSESEASRSTSRKDADAPSDSHHNDDDFRARTRAASRQRASMISPIPLFDNGDARRRNTSRTSSLRSSPPRRADDKTCLISSDRGSSNSRSERISQKDEIQSKSEVCSTKRKYNEGKSPKRRRISQEVQNIDSASSVSGWLSRNVAEDATGVSNSLVLSARDYIDTVLEKLDTTLQEIHYNTSKKLVNMFVEAGRSYADVQAERGRLCRAGVRDVLADVVKIVDAKFTDLESRCSELGAAWERGLRDRARTVLRDDCRQKRDMVALLRDELRAARPDPRPAHRPARSHVQHTN